MLLDIYMLVSITTKYGSRKLLYLNSHVLSRQSIALLGELIRRITTNTIMLQETLITHSS